MNEAPYLKRKEEYPKALKTINRILEADPDFSDALYLKAQILWERFGNHGGAKRYLKKIIDTADNKQDTIYRWAVSLTGENDEAIEKNESYEQKSETNHNDRNIRRRYLPIFMRSESMA